MRVYPRDSWLLTRLYYHLYIPIMFQWYRQHYAYILIPYALHPVLPHITLPAESLEQWDDVKWPPFMVGQWDGLFVLPLYHYIPILSYYNISSLLPLYYQYYQYTTMISLLYIYITSLSSVCCIYMTNITTNHMPSICQVYIYQSYTSYINVVTQL